MHNVSFEETRKHVPLDALGAIHVYRLHTEFSQFVMEVVENIREREDLQRIVILVQKGVEASVIDDATQRIAELLEGACRSESGEACGVSAHTPNGLTADGFLSTSPLSADAETPSPVRENRAEKSAFVSESETKGNVLRAETPQNPTFPRKIALECFHGLTRTELRRLKRNWKKRGIDGNPTASRLAVRTKTTRPSMA